MARWCSSVVDLFRGDRAAAHALGSGRQLGDVGAQCRAGRHDHCLRPASGQSRHRQVEVLGGPHVGHLAVQREELGDVLEPGKAAQAIADLIAEVPENRAETVLACEEGDDDTGA